METAELDCSYERAVPAAILRAAADIISRPERYEDVMVDEWSIGSRESRVAFQSGDSVFAVILRNSDGKPVAAVAVDSRVSVPVVKQALMRVAAKRILLVVSGRQK